jgi:hypothetical protein
MYLGLFAVVLVGSLVLFKAFLVLLDFGVKRLEGRIER